MSEGKGSEGNNLNSKIKKIGCSGSDNFGRQFFNIDVLQIAIQFVFELEKIAHFYINLSRRTGCKEFDNIQALEDLDSSQSHHCLVGSEVVPEITQFVSLQEEIPFG